MARLTDEQRELILADYSQVLLKEASVLEKEGIERTKAIRCALNIRSMSRDVALEDILDHFSLTIIELAAIINATTLEKKTGSCGEQEVEKYLTDNLIQYRLEHTFDSLKGYRFDFYIPELRTCIEFDGMQHYKPVDFFGGDSSFIKGLERDERKNKYCEDNGLTLIRIPFYYINQINELLEWKLYGIQ